MTALFSNLMVRFSVVSLVIMVSIAVVIAMVLSNAIRSDAIDDLVDEAVGTSSGRLIAKITPEDLQEPMIGERYDNFHRFVQESIQSARTARVKLFARDGTVIYSSDRAGVGEKFPKKENLLIALSGRNATEIKIPSDPENRRETHLGTLMEVYTPILFPGIDEPLGAFEIYQYYLPTAERIAGLQRKVLWMIGIGFSVLYAGLISIVAGGWRTIKTQQNELESFNLQLAVKVKDRTSELESFSHAVSHDLRGPLRDINGFGQALYEDCWDSLGEEGKEYLTRIRASTFKMENLIDGLLDLSRLSGSELERETVDLIAVATDIAAELKEKQPHREVDFIIGTQLVVDADPRLLWLALEDLLGNAWKYTSTGSHAVIEMGADSSNGHLVYFVRDDGVGFEMEYAEKLFGAFKRFHPEREFEGTGIGLATVQRIIQRHGGDITAEGLVGSGATFYFTLPPEPVPST